MIKSMYEVYDASGDLVYIISGDPIVKVKVKNEDIGVKVKNEVLNVSSEGSVNVSVQSGNAIPVSLVSQNASYNASDYTCLLTDISNNSYMLVVGMLFIFVCKVVFNEVRRWK